MGRPTLRVLVALDSFKGTLSARQAAAAMRSGVMSAGAECGLALEVDECPLADGGEGTLQVVARATGATTSDIVLSDLLGAQRTAQSAQWRGENGRMTTLVESAQVIGLELVPLDQRDPESLSTTALGELIDRVRRDDDAEVLVALGGSSTVDGGVGVAAALGVRFDDEHGRRIVEPTALDLGRIALVTLPPADSLTRQARMSALCDVDCPLLGPEGAARIFGPQKGATSAQVERLERGLKHLADVAANAGIEVDPGAPGSGAAGGLGFGMAAFLGAALAPGGATVLELVGFHKRVARADLIMTGEGRLDTQSARGKVIACVSRAAAEHGVPVVAVVGQCDGSCQGVRHRLAQLGVVLSGVHTLAPSEDLDSAEAAARAKRVACEAFIAWWSLR